MINSKDSLLKIKQGYVLPFFIRVASIFVFLGIIVTLLLKPFLLTKFLIFCVVGYFCFMVFTARHFLEFDMKNRICFKYIWVLGLKLGGKRPFKFVEKLFVNKIQLVSVNKYNTNSLLNEMRNVVYRCYLKFDDGEKILFDEDVHRDNLFKRLITCRDFLETELYDTTTHEAVLVD